MANQTYADYPLPGYLTTKQYAEWIGISEQALRVKVDRGKLKGCVIKDSLNRLNFDKEKCDAALAHPNAYEASHQKKKPATEELDQDIQTSQAYNRARSANEVIKLQKAQIELQELKGSLVSIEVVKREQFLMSRLLRDQMMSIPDRISALLASMTDEREIHKELVGEIRQALKNTETEAREQLHVEPDSGGLSSRSQT